LIYRVFTISTLILYSLAAFNDPGYVKTNLFKVETENVIAL